MTDTISLSVNRVGIFFEDGVASKRKQPHKDKAKMEVNIKDNNHFIVVPS